MSSPACVEGYDTPAQQREDSTTFMAEIQLELKTGPASPAGSLNLTVMMYESESPATIISSESKRFEKAHPPSIFEKRFFFDISRTIVASIKISSEAISQAKTLLNVFPPAK